MNKTKKELYEDIYSKKFSFGKNWEIYIKNLNNEKINFAKNSLINFTQLKNFKEKKFIDLGCGSGLFSLAAYLLGAKKIVSIDVDDHSLNCTKQLRDMFKINSNVWEIKKGSILDETFVKQLNKYDIVYSWGVLHHTGNLKKALENAAILVKNKGLLYIAVYNDFKGFPSSNTWFKIKRYYSSHNKILRRIMEWVYVTYYVAGLIVYGKNPIKYIKNYDRISTRGMGFYRDAVDWLGGYPYEFASVEKIINFYKNQGFKLINLKKTNREGCNQYLLKREKTHGGVRPWS